MFKRNSVITIDKMNVVDDVVVNDDRVKFSLNYSAIDIGIGKVPGLVSDLIQIYGIVKPSLDDRSEEITKKGEKDNSGQEPVEEIDLSNIPF